MSKYTAQKKGRILEVIKVKMPGKKGVTLDKIVKRSEKLPAIPRKQHTCPVCKKPIMISIGQLVYCHKTCRKQFRANLKRYGGKE